MKSKTGISRQRSRSFWLWSLQMPVNRNKNANVSDPRRRQSLRSCLRAGSRADLLPFQLFSQSTRLGWVFFICSNLQKVYRQLGGLQVPLVGQGIGRHLKFDSVITNTCTALKTNEVSSPSRRNTKALAVASSLLWVEQHHFEAFTVDSGSARPSRGNLPFLTSDFVWGSFNYCWLKKKTTEARGFAQFSAPCTSAGWKATARLCPAPSPAPIAASPQPSGGLGRALKPAPGWMFLLEKSNSSLTGEAGLLLWRGGM